MQSLLINWSANCLRWHAWCSPSVLCIVGKFLLGADGNFELVQLFLFNWSADCFSRLALCSPSVLCHDGKFSLEIVGLLSLCICSSSIGLDIVLLGVHSVLPLFYFVLGNPCLKELKF